MSITVKYPLEKPPSHSMQNHQYSGTRICHPPLHECRIAQAMHNPGARCWYPISSTSWSLAWFTILQAILHSTRATEHYRTLPITIKTTLELPSSTGHNWTALICTEHYYSLPIVAKQYQALLAATESC